ncbi:MAG: reductive dehalogenase [Candidatus Bathyarchaeota archaeon]
MAFDPIILLLADLALIGASVVALVDSHFEKETRAVVISGSSVIFHILFGYGIVYVPSLQLVASVYFSAIGVFVLALLIPGGPNAKALQGTDGYKVGNPEQVDERDIMFVRGRLVDGTERYDQYYASHPEVKQIDDDIRAMETGFHNPRIDFTPKNMSMMDANFHLCHILGPHADARPEEGHAVHELSPEYASEVVKNYVKHLGACDAGITMLNPNFVYSIRGMPDAYLEWGDKIPDLPKYAVMFTCEMDYEHVMASPHSPIVAESSQEYALGAYISTIVAHWFKSMGYHAVAQMDNHYDTITPPMAVDAGLGEIGRNGYLIHPKYGARTRVFGILTDMPLVPDKPISFGVEEYCTECKKCGTTCPSKSIPMEGMVEHNGYMKWKLEEHSCFEYWRNVGTDCGICMAACGFSRPHTPLHIAVKWFIKRSPVARKIFPIMDDLMYGAKWRPRKVSKWLEWTPR